MEIIISAMAFDSNNGYVIHLTAKNHGDCGWSLAYLIPDAISSGPHTDSTKSK